MTRGLSGRPSSVHPGSSGQPASSGVVPATARRSSSAGVQAGPTSIRVARRRLDGVGSSPLTSSVTSTRSNASATTASAASVRRVVPVAGDDDHPPCRQLCRADRQDAREAAQCQLDLGRRRPAGSGQSGVGSLAGDLLGQPALAETPELVRVDRVARRGRRPDEQADVSALGGEGGSQATDERFDCVGARVGQDGHRPTGAGHADLVADPEAVAEGTSEQVPAGARRTRTSRRQQEHRERPAKAGAAAGGPADGRVDRRPRPSPVVASTATRWRATWALRAISQ